MTKDNDSTPRVFTLDFTIPPSEMSVYLTVADPEREGRLRQAASEIGGVTITAVGDDTDQYRTVYRKKRGEYFLDSNGHYRFMEYIPTDCEPTIITPARPVEEGCSVLSITPPSLAGEVTLRSADILAEQK